MHIEGMTVGPSSHPAFQEPLQLEFDKRVNLFAGPNASGKTSLLRVLAYSGFVDKTAIFPFPAEEVRLSSDWEAMLGTRDGFDDAAIWGVPWIYIPATRLILPGGFDWNDGVQVDDGVEGEIDDVNWQDDARVFDGRWVERVCKVFYDKFKGQLNEGQRDFYGLLQALRTAYSCTKSISNEIMIGRPSNYVSHPYELITDPQDFEPLFDEPYVHPGMGVSTKYGESSKSLHQYVGDLSAGTQGTFLWVLYIALKIWRFYQQPDIPKTNEGKWQERPAILLIDEIENHLHPTWQRRVIPALLEHFPGLQIFATTHSPFVVGRAEGRTSTPAEARREWRCNRHNQHRGYNRLDCRRNTAHHDGRQRPHRRSHRRRRPRTPPTSPRTAARHPRTGGAAPATNR